MQDARCKDEIIPRSNPVSGGVGFPYGMGTGMPHSDHGSWGSSVFRWPGEESDRSRLSSREPQIKEKNKRRGKGDIESG